jgi:fucose 4-O-acetylase-like acetyltransferase
MDATPAALNNNRIDYLDFAKGFCMIAILLGHLGETGINRVVYTFHLPVFFIISGYFFDPDKSFGETISKKLKSLIWPYYFAGLLVVLFSVLANWLVFRTDFGTIRYDVLYWSFATVFGVGTNVRNSLLFMPPIGMIWFLWATFWAIILLWLLMKLPVIPRVILIVTIFVLANITVEKGWFLPLSIQPGCSAVLYMYIGFLWKKHKDKLVALSLVVKVLLIVFSVAVWALFILNFATFWLVGCDYGHGLRDVIGSISASAIVLGLSYIVVKYGEKFTLFIRFIGKYAIIAMTAQLMELNAFRLNDQVWRSLEGCMPYILALLILILIKLCWMYLFTWMFSRFRITRKLFGLKY